MTHPAAAPVLRTMLGNLVRSMEGVNQLAEDKWAPELGLAFLGKLDKQPPGSKGLSFPLDFDDKLRIKWDEVHAQLDAIGKPTALFTVPRQLLLGIRGSDGDIVVRLLDIQQHRLDGVLEYLS